MFVGEVRCATTGSGSSWKLSGGRLWSSGPTKVSKYRQVLRAARRSASTSVVDSCSAAESADGRLTRRATRGDSSHRPMNGMAIQTPGFSARTSTAVVAAIATPLAI